MTRPNMISRVTSRLTDLHENELSHILSRLSTNEVVQTSILSKEWRYKWMNSYNVDIVVRLNDEPQSFVKFMNTRLVSLQHIINFRLHCDLDDLNHIQAWIDKALHHKLESLYLLLPVDASIILPCSLLNSTCLRELELNIYESTLNVSMNSFAPNLTSLTLYGVDIVSDQSTSTTLKLSFPLLKNFSAAQYSWLNVTNVEIDAPSLTSFSSEPSVGGCHYFLEINSPRIIEFICTICLCEEIVVNGSSIVSATLIASIRAEDSEDEVEDSEMSDIGLRVRKMVNGFTNLQSLCLCGSFYEMSLLVYQVPRHNMLRKLDIFGLLDAELILVLLHKTPSLKVLEFSVREWADFDYEAIDSVPSCFESHLEQVRISDFTCAAPQYNLLDFLLKKGTKLKNLIMVHVPSDKHKEVEECVSMLGLSGLVLELRSRGY